MEKKTRHRLGTISELKDASWKTYRAMGKDLIVVWSPDGPLGYVNFCTHMGGKVRCASDEFVCDRHGAKFECHTGLAKDGTAAPSGSKLEKVELETEGEDIIYLHEEKKSPWAME